MVYNFDTYPNGPITISGPEGGGALSQGFWVLRSSDEEGKPLSVVFEKFKGMAAGDPEHISIYCYHNNSVFEYNSSRTRNVANIQMRDTQDAPVVGKIVAFGSAWMRGWKTVEYARQLYNNLIDLNSFKLTHTKDYTQSGETKEGLFVRFRPGGNIYADINEFVRPNTEISPAQHEQQIKELKTDIQQVIENLKNGIKGTDYIPSTDYAINA